MTISAFIYFFLVLWYLVWRIERLSERISKLEPPKAND